MTLRTRILLTVLVASTPAGLAQYDPSKPLTPETILLARTRIIAAENARRIPDFTCGMTIERSRRRQGSGRFERIDTLRLEVAFSGGKEMYAWPGASRFDERELADMVSNAGAIGTGDFASHVQSVLLSGSTVYEYEGKEELDAKFLHRFRYSVARNRSRYTMRIPPQEAEVGYRGSFLVDAISFDLIWLEIDVDDIPPNIPIRASRKVIELKRQRIGDTEFLLPSRSELSITMAEGTTTRNVTHFRDCHEFRGESSLVFEDAPADAQPVPATIQATLPEGLKLSLALKEPVALAGAATGDQVRFVVTKDAKMRGSVEAPKGAEFTARIDGLHCTEQPISICYLLLHLEGFRFANKEGQVEAVMEAPPLDPALGLWSRGQGRLLVPAEVVERPPTQGVLVVRGGRQTLKPGYSTVWKVQHAP